MKNQFRTIAFLTSCLLGVDAAQAILPQPDAILYGSVIVEGVTITENFSVIARVDGVEEPVGTYVYGSCANGESGVICPPADKFLLRIRTESLVDDSSQTASLDSAQLNQTVTILLKQSDGEEKSAGSFVLNPRGLVLHVNLSPETGGGSTNVLFRESARWYDANDPLLPAGLLGILDGSAPAPG